MPTFEVETPDGKSYEIEAPDQAAAIDAFKRFTSGDVPKDYDGAAGLAMNATAGVNQGLASIAGAPADMGAWLLNRGIDYINSLADHEALPPEQFKDPALGSGMMMDAMGWVNADPRDVVANTPAERIVRATAEAAAGGAVAGGIPGLAAKTGAVTAQTAARMTPAVGEVNVANTVANATAGAGGQAAVEIAPDSVEPLARIVGSVAGATVPAGVMATAPAAKEAVRAGKNFVEPMRKGGPKQIAGRALREAASDPDAAMTAAQIADELVPGSKPTTFQATGDAGLGQLERGVNTRNQGPFVERAAAQNQARVTSLQELQQKGNPAALSTFVRNARQEIDDELARLMDDAEATAHAARSKVGGMEKLPEDHGASMRAPLAEARAAAKERERALWDAVDPNDDLVINSDNVRFVSNETVIMQSPAAKPITGEEQAIFKVASSFKGDVPFKYLTDLRSRISEEMRDAKVTGRKSTYGRLRRLRGSIEIAIDKAMKKQAAAELDLVRRGEMAVEDTLTSRLTGWFDEAGRPSTATTTGAHAQNDYGAGGARTQTFGPSAHRTQSTANSRPGGHAGDQGLQGTHGRAVDAAAAQRLRDASDFTKTRVKTFDEGTSGEVLRPGARAGEYRLSDSQVPSKVFKPGPQGGESIRAYLNAGGGAALEDVRDYAAYSLRKAAGKSDGSLDPKRVLTWVMKHDAALKELPEDLANTFKDVAKAEEAISLATQNQRAKLAEFNKSALAPFLGVNDPSDVTNVVGSIFGRKTSATELGRLANSVTGHDEAMSGLRRSILDHVFKKFLSNAEAGTSGTPQIKGDQLQTFIRTNKPALQKVFNDDEIRRLSVIALDLKRSNRSVVGSRLPGRSNTAQDTLATARAELRPDLMTDVAQTGTATGIGYAILGWPGAFAGWAGKRAANAMRSAGLQEAEDLIEAAVLDPKLFVALVRAAKPNAPSTAREELVKVLQTHARSSAIGSLADGSDR